MDFFGILYDMKNGKKVPFSKTYFDTLFAAKLAQLEIKTLTGTLPLTFRTSETALRSWTIYGNNTQHTYSATGTLPLTFTTHTAGAASDWSISGNDEVGKNYAKVETGGAESGITFTFDPVAGTVTANGTATADAQCRVYFNNPGQPNNSTVPPGNYYFSGCPSGGSERNYNCYSWDYDAQARSKKWDGTSAVDTDYGQGNCQVQINGHKQSITMRIKSGYTADNVVFKPMLRPADTSADFEPYQVGVGQRTKNIFALADFTDYNRNNVVMTADKNAGIISIYSTDTPTASAQVTVYFIPATTGNYLMSGVPTSAYSGLQIYCWDSEANARAKAWDKTTNSETNDSSHSSVELYLEAGKEYSLNFRVLVGYGKHEEPVIVSPMVRSADSAAEFIPNGYEIPLSISQQGQTDKNYDIYIGSTPLTAGQSISKTSTGVDIAAVQGANTIATDLYNKPEMSIEGVDYVGVGEYVNGQWQIPLTVTHYTDNIFDKDAKNANKGYEDSTCIMWAGSIPYPYMTGNIPEDNNCFVSEKIPASPNTTYYLTDGIFKNTDNGIYSVFLWNRFRMSDYQAFPTEKTFTTGDDTKFIQLCVLKSYADTVMITTKPTETYIPHVEVNDVNVPIDAPLTEGQSITDTTTISTFEGENTIDTTMTNKPDMSITYKGG